MKERHERKSKFLIMFLVVSMLLPMFSGLAEASHPPEFDYMQDLLKEDIFKKAGKEFPQPDPMFRIETSDGQVMDSPGTSRVEADVLAEWEARGEPRGANSKNQGGETLPTAYILNQMEEDMVVPVGTVIKMTDITQKTPGASKIVERDWQWVKTDHGIYHPGSHHQNYWEDKSIKGNSNSTTVTADRPGWIYLFLSVADNGAPHSKSYKNWNSTGNYRTAGNRFYNYIMERPYKHIQGNTKDWFFKVVKIKVGGESEMILREMSLVDPEKPNEPLETFKRKLIDPLDPFSKDKQVIETTSNSIKDTETELIRGKEYEIRAKYQFISFKEGSFNTSDANNMNELQRELSTGVSPNMIDAKLTFDQRTLQQGVFDEESSEISIDKPNQELKNMQTASFKWKFTPPNDKKAVKISGLVPEAFQEVNHNKLDDWGTLFAMIEPADLRLFHPMTLLDESGRPTTTVTPGENHSVKINAKHFKGKRTVGLDPTGTPEGNDEFKILVSAREGSASGNYLKKLEKEKIHINNNNGED